jgi:tetratricopeptide (TPR) repeat protein
MGHVRPVTLLALLALGAGTAWAQSEDPVARARTHFEAGRALYQLGNYTEAAREFAAGYELVPKPQFLLNLGQCYRKLDQLEQARNMYQRYLTDAPASDPERPQAEQILDEIERQIAARQANAPPPPAPAPPARRTTRTATRPRPTPQPQATPRH